MTSGMARALGESGIAGTLLALVAGDGTATHRHAHTLDRANTAMRDVTDFLYLLCMLHGRQPGVVDHALAHAGDPVGTQWLGDAAAGFVVERQQLAALVATAGPMPRTPGQAETESAITAQTHALTMLAQSDRVGCAFGAAVALVLDWHAVRRLVDRAARRMGIDPAALALPTPDVTQNAIAKVATTPAAERAILFGAQQLLAQQRGLWDLLEARTAARHG